MASRRPSRAGRRASLRPGRASRNGRGSLLDDFLDVFRWNPAKPASRTHVPRGEPTTVRRTRPPPWDDWLRRWPFSQGSSTPQRLTERPSPVKGARAWWESPWIWVGIGLGGLCLIAALTMGQMWSSLPNPNDLYALRGDGTVVLLYDDQSPMEVAGKRPGPFLQPQDVPDVVRQAFVATEDRRFYEHKGVDFIGIARAVLADLGGGRLEGGSTITQQLVHMYWFPESEHGRRSILDKLREGLMAVKVEKEFTKLEVLQAYMTVIPYADGVYGVKDAAQYYFGKDVRNVTLAEAAMIVGAANATGAYNPHFHYDISLQRMQDVLRKMHNAPVINGVSPPSDEQLDAAMAERPLIYEKPAAPALWRWTVQRVLAKLNLKAQASERQTELVVHTTLDNQAQQAAEAAVLRAIGRNQPIQAVLVALDGTGAVRAFVPATTYDGGHGYADEPHQIGSVMKMFIYTAAMEAGAEPSDECDDVPGSFGGWSPRDDDQPKGRISLESAFAYSSNIVATRLANEVGYSRVSSVVSRLWLPPTVMPPSTIAAWPLSASATPLDLARALLPYASGGYVRPVRFVESVINGNGVNVLPPVTASPSQTLSRAELSSMDRVAHAVVTAEGATGRRAAVDGLWIAGKTGTTSEFRNAWFAGYGNGFVVVVWVGRPDQRPMDRVYGGTLPASIFRDFMTAQHLGWGKTPPAEADAPIPTAVPDEAPDGDPQDALLASPGLYHGPAAPEPGQGCDAGS